MKQIIYQRGKCIGCNYCAEADPEYWVMSKKDGKSNLIGSKENKSIYTLKVPDIQEEKTLNVAKNCPVKIIRVLSLKN
jgi:ferredoxin